MPSIHIANDNKATVMGAVLAMAYQIKDDPDSVLEAVRLEPRLATDPLTRQYIERTLAMKITGGKQNGAIKTCLYGPEGIGKSTFAAQFPNPLFLDTEDSTKFMDVQRFERPSSWTTLMEQVKYVRDNSPGLCGTFVVDTLDWAEKLCIQHICDKYQKDGLEAFDYGKGYVYVFEEMGQLLNRLTEITERGVHVLVTAHAATQKREQVDEFGSYDVWGLKLLNSSKCSVSNMVKEWADNVFFANYKTFVVAADSQGKKHKAQGGQRIMFTSHHPCWDAKNRIGLPEELPLEFTPLAKFYNSTEQNPVQNPVKTQGSNPPAPMPGPDPAPSMAQTDEMAVPEQLRPLLESANVTELEVRQVIAKRQGSFPLGTSWKVMEDIGFVKGWVLPFWDQIVSMIREDRQASNQTAQQTEFPF